MPNDIKLLQQPDGTVTLVMSGLRIEPSVPAEPVPDPVPDPVDPPPVEPDPIPDPVPDPVDPVDPPPADYDAFRVFEERAVTWLHFNKVGNLFWRNQGGDWIDADGVKQGDKPVSSAPVKVSATPQWVALDVTKFVPGWISEVNDGLFLRSVGGKANYHTRDHADETLRPHIEVITTDGLWRCQCVGDVAMSDTTSSSMGDRTTAQFGVGMIRFDLTGVTGDVLFATAYLYTAKQYGSHDLHAYYVDAPVPFDVGAQRVEGLAAAYLNDDGIEAHPDVIRVWDWPAGWKDNPIFERTESPEHESVLIDGRWWLKVAMPIDTTCSGDGEGTGLSVRCDLSKDGVPASIDPIPQVPIYPEEMYFRYSVMLGDDWTSVNDRQLTGGKFPGLVSRYGYPKPYGGKYYWQPTGANGGDPGTGRYHPASIWDKQGNFRGSSARGMFEGIAQGQPNNPMRNCTGMGSYLYYPEWTTPGTGETRMWRNAFLQNGRQHDVEQYIKMNDLGPVTDEYGNCEPIANGIFRAWMDGVLVEERTDVIWRKHPYIGIQEAWYLFKNGGTLSPCNPHTVYAGPAVVARSYIGPRNKSATTPKPEPINEPDPEPEPVPPVPEPIIEPIQGNGMTQFAWKPLASDIGAPPSNGISLGGQSDGAAVTVVDDGAGVPVLQIAGGTSGRRRKILLDAPGVFADGEAYVKFRMNTVATHRFGPYIRATVATSSYAVGYHNKHEQQASTQTDRIHKITGTSTSTALGAGTETDTCMPGQIMHSLLRVEGTTLSAKAWPEGATEPTAWEQVALDDVSHADGYAGLLAYGSPNVHVYFVGVGVGTDPAPRDGVTPDPIPDPEPEPDPIPVGTARLSWGSGSETGGSPGALIAKYSVFLDEDQDVVVQAGTVALDANGAGFIDVPNSPWLSGAHVLVLINTYDAALNPAQRTVRTQLGFVPVTEAP
jgi:hypothetical protein